MILLQNFSNLLISKSDEVVKKSTFNYHNLIRICCAVKTNSSSTIICEVNDLANVIKSRIVSISLHYFVNVIDYSVTFLNITRYFTCYFEK